MNKGLVVIEGTTGMGKTTLAIEESIKVLKDGGNVLHLTTGERSQTLDKWYSDIYTKGIEKLDIIEVKKTGNVSFEEYMRKVLEGKNYDLVIVDEVSTNMEGFGRIEEVITTLKDLTNTGENVLAVKHSQIVEAKELNNLANKVVEAKRAI